MNIDANKLYFIIRRGEESGWTHAFILDQIKRWCKGERGATIHDDVVSILGTTMPLDDSYR